MKFSQDISLLHVLDFIVELYVVCMIFGYLESSEL